MHVVYHHGLGKSRDGYCGNRCDTVLADLSVSFLYTSTEQTVGIKSFLSKIESAPANNFAPTLVTLNEAGRYTNRR